LDTESFKAAGAWVGPDKPLIRSLGEARRAIYLPVYLEQLTKITRLGQVRATLDLARFKYIKVFLRDFGTSYLINANRALSHAFLLSAFLSGRSWQELS